MRVPTIPVIQSTICLDELFDWLKACTATIQYGRVGIEFLVQDGEIVSYTPLLAPRIRPKQIVAGGLDNRKKER